MFLKEQKSKIICAAVEPKNAAILRTGHITDSKHIIQGTGYGIIPPLWKKDLADEILTVSDDEAIRYTKALAKDEGLYVGYSSGANVCAGLKLIKSNKLGKNPVVVTVLCDTAYKYSDL